ncbi:fibroblast growth factor-binding protein 1-like [Clarias magur]|uniref:Fibroblast growth factor-binding protein 1-like n=1 Tax=Clarias magur TaxID=1594786 RepID=A0A8J4U1X2_CLAMG|nr:fibroblast growth factor-binding protein 1-like [Clarias magur]
MRLCGNLAVFLLLVWLAAGEKRMGRKKDETKDGVVFRGNFSAQAGERCTWTVTKEKTQYTLNVTCLAMRKGKPRSGYGCEYTGEPALCPAFRSKPGAFWRQISRALKQSKRRLCADPHATLRARACKRATADAHFRFLKPYKEITLTTPALRAEPPEDTPTTACTRRADHRELAQEKCGIAWGTVCNFLFSMVQNGDC